MNRALRLMETSQCTKYWLALRGLSQELCTEANKKYQCIKYWLALRGLSQEPCTEANENISVH